jgi:RHS repeat-associated protein
VGSQLVATLEPWGAGFDVKYFHPDALGSVRAVTDAAGQTVDRYDYGAFGEGPGVTFSGEKQRFAGTERDFETLLDYMGARYYRSVTGRFNAVDPGHANGSLTRPQSWNAYAYASNNPLRFVDPTGMSDERITPMLNDAATGTGEGDLDSFADFYYNAPTSVGFSDYALYLSNPEGFLAWQQGQQRRINADMNISESGLRFLEMREGLPGGRPALTVYRDIYQIPTIGLAMLCSPMRTSREALRQSGLGASCLVMPWRLRTLFGGFHVFG